MEQRRPRRIRVVRGEGGHLTVVEATAEHGHLVDVPWNGLLMPSRRAPMRLPARAPADTEPGLPDVVAAGLPPERAGNSRRRAADHFVVPLPGMSGVPAGFSTGPSSRVTGTRARQVLVVRQAGLRGQTRAVL